MANKTIETQVVVLGSGPGGYSAAFRAADLGLKVVLVERYARLGGVCLNVGCIPSKQYLHVAEGLYEAEHLSDSGVTFGKAKIDIEKLRGAKENTVSKLTGGLEAMAKMRKVQIVHGVGTFSDANTLNIKGEKSDTTIQFEHAVIAAGSRPVKLPFIPEDPRVIDSTGALELEHTKGKMLVLGGGIIGCEMATVYNALGTGVTIVELMDQIMPGADKDLVKPCQKMLASRGTEILLKTKLSKVEAKKDGLYVTLEGEHATKKPMRFDSLLVAVGRIPNGKDIGAEAAGVNVDERGFIAVDKQLRTNVQNIHAIGDIVGNPMLAHKAVPEGRTAAEVISGLKHEFNPLCIPSVAYTDPEVAWVGLTEIEAKAQGIKYGKGIFPWAASGRALAMGRSEGMTKLLFCEETERLLGAGIVGISAGDMISEMALAIEMGCDAQDIALTIHPHPTLAESMMMSAEVFEGTATDLPPQRR